MSKRGKTGAYEIWQGTKVRLYFLYPLLTILEREGLVERRWTDYEPKRVMYALTEQGEDVANRYAHPN